MTAFGIDFGTTNSALAAAVGTDITTVALDSPPEDWGVLGGFDHVLPTVLAEIDGAIDFGWRAKRTPGHLAAVKRMFATIDSTVTIGSKQMNIEEAAGVFFRQIKERAARDGHTLDQAVVTIPANSRGTARYRTKLSAGLSGIQVLALVNEPTAAAMAYGRHIADGERVVVFDWGGGTLDVTVLRNLGGVFMEEASKGIQRLGGIDIDKALHEALEPRVPSGSRLDLLDIEHAKIRLSAQESTVLGLPGGGNIEISRDEFEDVIHPLINRTRDPVERCLSDADAGIDHLVMVGGSSKVPLARRFVSDITGLEPMAGPDPMTAVAEGAALAAGVLTGEITEYDFFVSTEHALGTVIHDESDRPRFSVLIARNTKLPANAEDAYNPKLDHQKSVLFRVIEGDPDAPFEHEDNVILKEWDVTLPEPLPVSEAGFNIRFHYDVEGILNVTAVSHKTGRTFFDEPLTFGASASRAELAAMRRRIDELPTVSPGGNGHASTGPSSAFTAPAGLSEQSRAVVRQAKEKIHPFVDDATQQQLDMLIQQLVTAPSEDEPAAREALEGAVREHSYLL